MTTINRCDKITLDAYSDPELKYTGNTGKYYRFKNRLSTPALNVKGIQLLNVNFVNTTLQLNDQYQLMFFYYAGDDADFGPSFSNLRCVRLYPSWYAGVVGFTEYTRNKYFNNVNELVATLNQAASAGGDSLIYNGLWNPDQITFSYNEATRKITVSSRSAGTYIAPAAADDPNVTQALTGGYCPTLYFGFTNPKQSFVLGQSMNARLGFAMSYYNTGPQWDGNSVQGFAWSKAIPTNNTEPIEADANPILLGTQNVNIYADIVNGSGLDSRNRKNLAGSVPIEVAPLNINSYTLTSVEQPLLSCANDIYEITIELLDDNGQPFYQPPSFNTQVSFSIYY